MERTNCRDGCVCMHTFFSAAEDAQSRSGFLSPVSSKQNLTSFVSGMSTTEMSFNINMCCARPTDDPYRTPHTAHNARLKEGQTRTPPRTEGHCIQLPNR